MPGAISKNTMRSDTLQVGCTFVGVRIGGGDEWH